MIDRRGRAGNRRLAVRWLTLLTGVVLTLALSARPPDASAAPIVLRARFVGQVTATITAGGSPTQFSLQEINQSVDIVITPKTNFVPGSAEANVEGLVRDDYAVVNARRVKGAWVAARIMFDVQPVPPLRAVSGTILRVAANGRQLGVKLDIGGTRLVTLARDTRFRLDGRLLDTPPILLKGQSIQLVVQNTVAGWVALEVDLRSAATLERRQASASLVGS